MLCVPGLALAVGLLLGGCGGRAGGGGPTVVDTVASAPTAPPVSSGLLPAPWAPGAVLYQDAAPLRMLRDGAAWTYRGIAQRGDAAGPPVQFYSNTVTVAHSGGVWTESADNAYMNLIDAAGTVTVERGQYQHTESVLINHIQVASGALVELSSPVRQNEQFVAIDRKGVPAGSDADGDGVNDKVDIAVWSRVFGKETFDLPNRRAVESVRVDMTTRVRIVLSRGDVATPVQELVSSVWYAPGLGIVRKRIDAPDLNPALPRWIATETLVTWDGVDEGLGYIAPSKAALPPGPPSARLRRPVAAAGFERHAVVAGWAPDQAQGAAIALTQLDARGKAMATRTYGAAELFPGADYLDEPRLLRVGEELRLVARTSRLGVAMAAFDSGGQRILRAPVVLLADTEGGAHIALDLEGNSYRIVQGGGRLWLNWVRIGLMANGGYQRALQLQAFDAAGQALGGARTLRGWTTGSFGQVGMVFADDRVALVWREGDWSRGGRLALVDAASGTLTERALDLQGTTCGEVALVALQPGLAMTCRDYTPKPLLAVRIDSAGNPVLDGTGRTDEAVQAPSLTAVSDGSSFVGGGGELSMVTRQYETLWPDAPNPTRLFVVARTRSVDGRLAGGAPLLLARMPAELMTVDATIPMGNRLLLLGSDGYGDLATAVVWLPN